MPIISVDELGPWIDLEHGAIRPAAPTRLKAGDQVDSYHFGGSTLHGVGKLEGRGRYAEAWLSAPKSKAEHEAYLKSKFAFHQVGFDFSWQCYLSDLAVFHRANPVFEPEAASQAMLACKQRREKYLASIGHGFGKVDNWVELVEEGGLIAGGNKARFEASQIAVEASGGAGPSKKGPRV